MTSQQKEDTHGQPFSLTAAFVAALFMLTSPALAQQQCTERDKVLKRLASKYQEVPVAMGISTAGGLVEVLTSEKTGTWTIIVTNPQGISCLVASGEGWRGMEAKQQGHVI